MSVGGASDLNAIITTPALVALFMNTKSTAIFFSSQDSFIHNCSESQGNTVALPFKPSSQYITRVASLPEVIVFSMAFGSVATQE